MKRTKLKTEQSALIRERINAALRKHRSAYEIPESSSDADLFENVHERNLALLKGTYWDIRCPGVAVKQINHLQPCLQTKHVVVTGGNVEFLVHGTEERFESVAEDARGLINHAWETLKINRVTARCEYDRYAHRFGVCEVYWRYETSKAIMIGGRPIGEGEDVTLFAEDHIPDDALPVIPGMEQSFMPGRDIMQPALPSVGGSSPSSGWGDDTDLPMQAQGEGAVTPLVDFDEAAPYTDSDTVYDNPMVERFSPMDFFVDPGCTSPFLEDARYCFRRKGPLVSEVKRNSAYHNTEEIKGTLRTTYDARKEDTDGSRASRTDDSLSDDIQVCELYDGYFFIDVDNDGIDELMHIVFCPEIQKELLCEEMPYRGLDRTGNPFPFRVIPCRIVDNDDFYQVSDIEMVADIQRAHDQAYTQIEYQRSHSPNVLVLPDELRGTDEGLRLEKTLTSGVENAIAWVPAQYIGVISWLKPAPLPELSYKALADAKPRILENIGVSEYQTLSVPTGPERTKFEVNQIAQQGNTRQASEIQMYLDFVQDVAWCVLTLFQQFIDPEKERAYRTVDPTGHPRYGMASVFQLRNGKPKDGEVEDFSSLLEPGLQFAITVDPTKVNQPDIYQDRQNMVELLGVLDKYADMPDPLRPTDPTATLINRRAMLESLISSFDLPNQEEIIRNPPSEDEKQDIVAQLQQKLAQTMQVIQKMGQQMQGMQPGAAPAPGQQPVPQPMPGQGVPAPQEIPGGLPQ